MAEEHSLGNINWLFHKLQCLVFTHTKNF